MNFWISAPFQQYTTMHPRFVPLYLVLSTVSSLTNATQETQGFTQATQGLKHAHRRLAREIEHCSNLAQAISRDKFQPRHWPLLAYVAFVALRALPKAGNRALVSDHFPTRAFTLHLICLM